MKFYYKYSLKSQFKRINSAGTLREPAEYSIINEYPFSSINSTNEYMYLSTAEELVIPVNNKDFMITNYKIHFTMDISSEFNVVDVYHDNSLQHSFYGDTNFTGNIITDVNNIKIVNHCLDGNIKIYFDTGLINTYIADYQQTNYPLDINTSNDIASIKIDNKVKSNLLYNDKVYTSIRHDKNNVYYQQDIIIRYLEYKQLKLFLDNASENKKVVYCVDNKQDGSRKVGYDENFFGENFGNEDISIEYSLVGFKVTSFTGIYYHCTLILRKESYAQYI